MGCLAGSVRNGSWCPYRVGSGISGFSDPASGVRQRHSHRSLWVTAASPGSAQIQGEGTGTPLLSGKSVDEFATYFQSTVALNMFAGWLEAKFPHLFCPRSAQFSPPCPPLLRHHDTGMCENWPGRAAWWPKSHRPMTHRLLLCSPGLQCGCLGHAFSKTLPAVAVTVTVTVTLGSPFLLALCQGGRRGSPWGFAP